MNAGEITSEEIVRSLLERSETREAAQCLRPSRSRARAGPGPRHRRAAQGGRAARSTGGRSGRDQGRALRRRRAHDLRQPHAPELQAPVRRHGHRQAQGGGRDPVRQDEHGRVCDGLVDREQRVWPDLEPLGRDAGAGRFLGRLGRGSRGRPGSIGPGHRHRRLDPAAGGLLRRGRAQADLWPCQPLRPDRFRQLARPDRPVRPRPGRRRPPLGCDRRAAIPTTPPASTSRSPTMQPRWTLRRNRCGSAWFASSSAKGWTPRSPRRSRGDPGL